MPSPSRLLRVVAAATVRHMILIGQYDSPFVRRVAVTLNLYGIEFEHRPWSVWGDAERIKEHNPLRRVPTLVLDDGTALVETLAILDALDERVGEPRAMLPRSGPVRQDGLRLCAFIGGVAEKSVSLLYERLFRDAAAERWTARCKTQIEDTLDLLERDLTGRGSPYWHGAAPGHADVALTCTWRFTREAHPQLLDEARWPALAALAERCERLPAFSSVVQPITNNMGAASVADHDLELFIVDKNDTSWSMRPWLLLVHHGIPFAETSFVAADPETPAKLRALGPTGKVPVLRIGEQTIWESLAIIETLADLYPKLAIWPRSAHARRHARAIAAEMHAGFNDLRRHCTMNLALRTTVQLDPSRQRELARFEAMVEAARRDTAVESRKDPTAEGPFLFGEFSAADAMLAPVATRIRSYGLSVGAITRAWMDAIFALPAFQRWEREAAHELLSRPVAAQIGVPLGAPIGTRIPEGPCYAVIFANQRTPPVDDYAETAERMLTLAQTMPGYLGYESARGADGFGITVSYWSSEDAIATFRAHSEHRLAQAAGRERYYESYDLRVARVERHVAFRSQS